MQPQCQCQWKFFLSRFYLSAIFMAIFGPFYTCCWQSNSDVYISTLSRPKPKTLNLHNLLSTCHTGEKLFSCWKVLLPLRPVSTLYHSTAQPRQCCYQNEETEYWQYIWPAHWSITGQASSLERLRPTDKMCLLSIFFAGKIEKIAKIQKKINKCVSLLRLLSKF